MSVLKPVAKIPRTSKPSPKLDSVTPQDLTSPHPEESDLPTSSTPTEMKKKPAHPKGHSVRDLTKVWGMLDAQSFLRLTDTFPLNDVLVQPMAVEPTTGQYVTVKFREIVDAPNIKHREAISKLSTDDLLQILYLNDCLQWDMQGFQRVDFESWLADKTASFIKAHGVGDSTNRSMLCNFIITEDKEFTFYPRFMKCCAGIFFRKTCYHSYQNSGDEKKMKNPAMIKCCSTRGKFEYILQAKLVILPDEFSAVVNGEEEDLPATQPLF